MTPDDLAPILRLVFAESGTAPTLELAAIWWEAIGQFPTPDVRREVVAWLASHRWPPKASDIAARLTGTDEHALALATTAVLDLVADGRMHPQTGDRLTPDDFPDAAAWEAHLECGSRMWYDLPAREARKRYEEAYARQMRQPARPQLAASPDAKVLPMIGRRA